MGMKILHTSDWHLGRHLEGRSRIQEQREVIEEIAGIVEREDIRLILIAGDIFDTYNPPAEAEELFYDSVVRLAGNGQRAVVVIAGNHDSPDRLLASDALARKQGIFLLGYPGDNLYRTKDAETVEGIDAAAVDSAAEEVAAAINDADYTISSDQDADAGSGAASEKPVVVNGGPGWFELKIPKTKESAVIAAVPYPSEQRLNQVISDSMEDKEMQKAYAEKVAEVFQLCAQNYRPDTVNLAVSHLFALGGWTSDSEREIQLGGAYIVEPARLPEQAHYIALGHLHRPQAVGGTPVPCRYSGSPLCYSFSEADQQKEVVLVDITPGGETEISQIKLTAGKPLRRVRLNSYEEAVTWCSEELNHHAWVEMELLADQPLQGSMVANLRKLHPGLVNIRVILPGIALPDENIERVSGLSLEEKFRRFVVRETGTEPVQELTHMLVELLEEGEKE